MSGFLIAVTVIFLLFPIFASAENYFDWKGKKIWFLLNLYGFPVVGGYLDFDKEGIGVHFSPEKQKKIAYRELVDTRKKFDFTQGFLLYKIRQIIEIGPTVPEIVLPAALFLGINGGAMTILRQKNPFLSVKNRLILCEEGAFRVSGKLCTVFNLLIVLIALFKKLLEVLIEWKRTKLTAYSKRLQRS